MDLKCASCGLYKEPNRAFKYSYCKDCHNKYMREHRRKHKHLNPEQKQKVNARSYLNVYIKRGKITRLPCQECGNPESEAHHHDYSKPLDVIWLCREHHLALHN